MMKQRFLKSGFSSLPNNGEQTFSEFLIFFLWALHVGGSISLSFLEMKKNKKSLNFCFHHYQGFSKSLRRKTRLKRAIYHKGVHRVDNLLKRTITSTFNFQSFCKNSSAFVSKVGCSGRFFSNLKQAQNAPKIGFFRFFKKL